MQNLILSSKVTRSWHYPLETYLFSITLDIEEIWDGVSPTGVSPIILYFLGYCLFFKTNTLHGNIMNEAEQTQNFSEQK